MAAAREFSGGNRRWAIVAASYRAAFSTKTETRCRSFPSLINTHGRRRDRRANDFPRIFKNFAPGLVALLLAAGTGMAEVRLASPFTSHMVLQRDLKVPVWGTADAGERVTVEFAGQKISGTADADGTWRVDLKPLDASAEGRTFRVTGSHTAQPVKLDDVLVGEVWLASGQSNMDFSMSKKVKYFAGVTNEDAEIAAANYPLIRMFIGEASKA